MTKDRYSLDQSRALFLRELSAARYLLEKTYPLVQEEKLFLAALEHLAAAGKSLLDVLYSLAAEKGELGADVGEVALLSPLARVQELDSLSLPSSLLFEAKELLLELFELEKARKNDLISFKRKNSYIICENNYKVQVISLPLLQDYLRRLVALGDQVKG